MKVLAEEETQVADANFHTDGSSFSEYMQSTFYVCNKGKSSPSFYLSVPHGADASPHVSDPVVEDCVQHGMDATSTGFSSASTSIASMSGCYGPVGEAELEINIPIEEGRRIGNLSPN